MDGNLQRSVSDGTFLTIPEAIKFSKIFSLYQHQGPRWFGCHLWVFIPKDHGRKWHLIVPVLDKLNRLGWNIVSREMQLCEIQRAKLGFNVKQVRRLRQHVSIKTHRGEISSPLWDKERNCTKEVGISLRNKGVKCKGGDTVWASVSASLMTRKERLAMDIKIAGMLGLACDYI